jgi:hypothetical protein
MLDVRGSREIQAVLLTLKQADRLVRNDLNKQARTALKPIWFDAVRSRVNTKLEAAVILPGVRVAAANRQITFRAAGNKKALKGGLVPADDWQGVEFGMRVQPVTYEAHSPNPNRTSYDVTRRIGTQFPNRQRHGQIAMAAAQESGTKLVAIWVRTIVDGLTARGSLDATGER